MRADETHERAAVKLIVDIQWASRSAHARALARLLPRKLLFRWIAAALDTAVVREATIGLRWVGEEEGRSLNRIYRRKDCATNVLTFDYRRGPNLHADIVICLDVVLREALGHAPAHPARWTSAQRQALMQHAAHLIVHGVLHAQGYDHERRASEAREMENLEMLLLHSLGFGNPYASV